jgi:lauroyl/myristoyl acyltransferase
MSAESRAEKLLHVFQQIPLGIRKAFFVRLGLLAYAADSRHRLITLHNLRMAFPEKPDDELRRIAGESIATWGSWRRILRPSEDRP